MSGQRRLSRIRGGGRGRSISGCVESAASGGGGGRSHTGPGSPVLACAGHQAGSQEPIKSKSGSG